MRRGRTARRSKGKRGSKVKARTRTSKAMRKTSKVKKGKKSKKKMNAYMMAKEKARKSGAETFSYNGTTYKQATTKTGMVIYKKA